MNIKTSLMLGCDCFIYKSVIYVFKFKLSSYIAYLKCLEQLVPLYRYQSNIHSVNKHNCKQNHCSINNKQLENQASSDISDNIPTTGAGFPLHSTQV